MSIAKSIRSRVVTIAVFFMSFVGSAFADDGSVFFKFNEKCTNYSNTLANQIKCIFKVNADRGTTFKFTESDSMGSFYQRNKNDDDGQIVYTEIFNWPVILNSKKTNQYSKVMNYSFDQKQNNQSNDLFRFGLLFLNNKEIDSTNSVIISVDQKNGQLDAKVLGNEVEKKNLFQLGDSDPIYCSVETKLTDIYIACNCTGFES